MNAKEALKKSYESADLEKVNSAISILEKEIEKAVTKGKTYVNITKKIKWSQFSCVERNLIREYFIKDEYKFTYQPPSCNGYLYWHEDFNF